MLTRSEKPKRTRRWGITLVVALVVFVITPLFIVYLLGRASTTRWRNYAVELRAGGDPLTFAEIEARRTKIPDERNSALVIERLSDRLNNLEAASSVFVLGRRSSGDTDFFTGIHRDGIAPSRDFLEQHRELLEELSKELRDKPTGRFAIDYNNPNPYAILLPELSPVRAASELVGLDGLLKLIDGDTEGAAATVRIQFHISGTLDEHPTLIARLVQIAIDALAVRTIENTLRSGRLRDKTLRELIQIVDGRLQAGTIKLGVLSERAFFVSVCNSLVAGKISLTQVMMSTDSQAFMPFVPDVLIRVNQIRGARMYTSFIDAADDPVGLLKAAQRVDREVATLGPTQFLVKTLFPSLSRSIVLHEIITAKLRCTKAALEAERFRLATGRLPISLNDLVPEYLDAVPTDPFGGKPMRFAVTEKGIVIYSVGENLIDDGGKITWQKTRPRRPDVGFRLFKAGHRGILLIDPPPDDGD